LYLSSPAPPPTAFYPLSLHDALPISRGAGTILLRQPALLELQGALRARGAFLFPELALQLLGARTLSAQHRARLRHLLLGLHARDRKSTRLNSSHRTISYAVFCLKKK